jgi:hypothetical protein
MCVLTTIQVKTVARRRRGQSRLAVLANSHPYKYPHFWRDFKTQFVLLELLPNEIASLIFIASDHKRDTNPFHFCVFSITIPCSAVGELSSGVISNDNKIV